MLLWIIFILQSFGLAKSAPIDHFLINRTLLKSLELEDSGAAYLAALNGQKLPTQMVEKLGRNFVQQKMFAKIVQMLKQLSEHLCEVDLKEENPIILASDVVRRLIQYIFQKNPPNYIKIATKLQFYLLFACELNGPTAFNFREYFCSVKFILDGLEGLCSNRLVSFQSNVIHSFKLDHKDLIFFGQIQFSAQNKLNLKSAINPYIRILELVEYLRLAEITAKGIKSSILVDVSMMERIREAIDEILPHPRIQVKARPVLKNEVCFLMTSLLLMPKKREKVLVTSLSDSITEIFPETFYCGFRPEIERNYVLAMFATRIQQLFRSFLRNLIQINNQNNTPVQIAIFKNVVVEQFYKDIDEYFQATLHKILECMPDEEHYLRMFDIMKTMAHQLRFRVNILSAISCDYKLSLFLNSKSCDKYLFELSLWLNYAKDILKNNYHRDSKSIIIKQIGEFFQREVDFTFSDNHPQKDFYKFLYSKLIKA